ncbi:MAG: CPBP family intramembrane metalloprotease [Chloroflexi bacterium]|nr:CPBP family intramembrane metalloprotease [Chloroflexota bacterium]
MNDTTGLKPWRFFALTFGWTWGWWLLAVVLGFSFESLPGTILMALGGIGPTVGALVLLWPLRDRPLWRSYWRRAIDVRRIPGAWYAVIFLFTPLLTLTALGIDALLNGASYFNFESVWLAGPGAVISSALLTLFFGPVPEELGWRGYALSPLQKRHGPLRASLILGVLWSAWHLPLFLLPGAYQYEMGLGTLTSWRYFLSIIPEAIFITWVFNHTERSTLAAILFHFVTNFNPVESLFVLSDAASWYQLALRCALALVISMRWGAEMSTSD